MDFGISMDKMADMLGVKDEPKVVEAGESEEESVETEEVEETEEETEVPDESNSDNNKENENDTETEEENEESEEQESEENEESETDNQEEESSKQTEEAQPFTPNAELLEFVGGGEYKTQDEFFTAVSTKIKSDQEATEKYKKRDEEYTVVSKKLKEIFDKNPELTKAFELLGQGVEFQEAAIEAGLPDLFPVQGDFDYDDFQKRMETRRKNIDERLSLNDEIEHNAKRSFDKIQSFAKDKSRGAQFIDSIITSIGDISMGKLNDSYLELFDKGMHYDQKVNELQTQIEGLKKEADEREKAALVKGRNEKIKKERVLKDKSKDTELPDISSGGNAKNKTKDKDAAELMNFIKGRGAW